jgi:hypothetical protein
MQLADELPMIYTVCIMAFATFSYRKPVKVQLLVAVALVGLAVFITVGASYLTLLYIREKSGLMVSTSRFTIFMPRTRSSIRLHTVCSQLVSFSAVSMSWSER